MIDKSLKHGRGWLYERFVNAKLWRNFFHQRPIIIFSHVKKAGVYVGNAYALLVIESIASQDKGSHIADDGAAK
ncbi:hypothetical protein SS37A_29320 [Methylocystis iwaonis]|uniref:Uncharacterized protein n=1 Tax=Methylocystis iwaonis TaxID=2885079 RepID=A0ABM8EBM8_9HYPH|nr:hypothetical protein SS37A_29320 [Methylocystis iwaonis]